jgi:hypothetical protein
MVFQACYTGAKIGTLFFKDVRIAALYLAFKKCQGL